MLSRESSSKLSGALSPLQSGVTGLRPLCPSFLLVSYSLVYKNLMGICFPSKILPIKLKQEAPSGRPGFRAIFLASPEQPGMGKSEHLLNLISCFDFAPRAPLGLRLSMPQPLLPALVCLPSGYLLAPRCFPLVG